MTHLFEVSKEIFMPIMHGEKRHIVTKKDRPYTKGDSIIIQEVDGENGFTSDELLYEISLVENDEGLKANYCIIAFIPHKIN